MLKSFNLYMLWSICRGLHIIIILSQQILHFLQKQTTVKAVDLIILTLSRDTSLLFHILVITLTYIASLCLISYE